MAGEVFGSISLDGNLADWSADDRIDETLSASGYDVYGKSVGSSYVFALKAPSAIGATTTVWLNTDRDSGTGYRIWGFAGGAEYNVNFDAAGVPRLYTGADGQTLVPDATISYGYSADRTAVEFALAGEAIGSPAAIDTLYDINNNTFLPSDYSAVQYTVGEASVPPPTTDGSIILDGGLGDWSAADQIDSSLSASGYDIYAKLTGGSYVFALQAPEPIGATTTIWLNSDRDAATGYQIWGFAGGAEYNIDIDSSGVPRLYTGADGETLVHGATVLHAYSADRTVIELSVAASAIGSPSAINTLYDINNSTFLPNDYSATQYAVGEVRSGPRATVVGSVTLDGEFSDWTAADQIDRTLSQSGYDIYAKPTGGSYVFALQAPEPIGANTTVWLNTDRNAATGHQIWGFAGGAEYNIDFDASGVPRLHTGADGQFIESATIQYHYSADRTRVEFALPTSAIGTAGAINTLWDVNDTTFLPTDYSTTQYTVGATVAPPLPPVIGDITLNGSLSDWTAADQIDQTFSVGGYNVYAKGTGASYVFAIEAPVPIGAATTVWLNVDQNAATGHQIWGFAGGAEYNIDFDAAGTPRLYAGAEGETLVSGANLLHAYSADRTIVEFALPAAAIGSPGALNTLFDINNQTFLPSDYSATQYAVSAPAATAQKIAIVHSATTAANYFSPIAYAQLFMAAQNQAAMAGVPFDIVSESDLTDLTTLAQYDALVFPSFSHVQAGEAAAIANTLRLAVERHDIGLIASGDFMTNDQTGAVLPGDPYVRMAEFFGLTSAGGGSANVTLAASDVSHPMMSEYAAGEVIRNYNGAEWQAFAPVLEVDADVLATQTIGGETHGAVIATSAGDGAIHFSTNAVLGDNNLLWQAIDFVVNGGGVSAGLQLSRASSVVAARVDVDLAFAPAAVDPVDGSPGVLDKLMPIVQQWKAQYGFVGSYYIDIGDDPPSRETIWEESAPYYLQLLALGNELGSHSISHPFDTNVLTPEELEYEFAGAKQIIETEMSRILGQPFTVEGAAVPGASEELAAALAMLQYYDYLTGGFSGVGTGYPNGFGYLTPEMAAADKVYFAPNLQFDFQLVEFQGRTPDQASAEWARKAADLRSHADLPIMVWPWHEYAATEWQPAPSVPSPYSTEMFTQFIANAHGSGTEFVTLDDLSERISAFHEAALTTTVTGSTVTVSIDSADAGRFAVDLDHLGAQGIARVTDWFAYDNDSVFLPRTGGTFQIQLGATAEDVTRIVKLPMRAELVSLSGDGTTLSFAVVGEGNVVVDLRNPAARQYEVSGARPLALAGEQVELALDQIGSHEVVITLSTGNKAPVFTAANLVSVAENTQFVMNVIARDANIGDTLTYSITGGADAARFTIDAASGALRFVAAPDFEAPADQGRNNVYDILVGVRDNAGASASHAVSVRVSDAAGVTLIGGAGPDVLVGTPEQDTLLGGSGDDTLDGGAAADVMNGALGNDTYGVDHDGDVVVEFAGNGTDLVRASINYTLGTAVENLTLTGSTINGGGNAQANAIVGNDLANAINGGVGNDTIDARGGTDLIVGAPGADTLRGGPGSDRFDYNAIADGTDTIVDFTRGAAGDRLDIASLLTGYTPDTSNISNFVRLSGTTSTTVSVNADGTGADFVPIVTLQNIAMSSTLLSELIAQGNLVLPSGGGAIPRGNLVGITGDSFIDGLAQGSAWDFNGGSRVITYSLSLDDTEPQRWDTSGLRSAVEQGLQAWSNVANVTFVEVGSGTVFTESTADIAITLTAGDLQRLGAAALALFPDPAVADAFIDAAGYTRAEYPRPEGDIFLDTASGAFSHWFAGQLGLKVILQEIGHALGLKHAGDGGANGRPTYQALGIAAFDNLRYTVMTDTPAGADPTTGHPFTPMLYDILTIQHIYGANGTHNNGDNTYFWSTGLQTIWDTGGIDTIDSSAAASAAIDLRQGAFSTSADRVIGIAWGATIENAVGGFGNDTIIGNELNNVLDGGGGADRMEGGPGNDSYTVDNTGDAVTERASEGVDTVIASLDFVLGPNLENLFLTAGANATGNELDNEIFGNEVANVLVGNAGNDVLDGAGGPTNTLRGGTGNDIYVVRSDTDSVVELAGAGIDTVHTWFDDYTLGANLENLTLFGAAGTGTGNALGNVIVGTLSENILHGGAGNDHLDGGMHADAMHGGSGNDTYIVDVTNIPEPPTYLELRGEPGNFLLNGSVTVTPDTGTFDVTLLDDRPDGVVDGLRVDYSDATREFHVVYSVQTMQQIYDFELQPGSFPGAYLYGGPVPTSNPDRPAMRVSGTGDDVSEGLGLFFIYDLLIDESGTEPALVRLSSDFEFSGNGAQAPVRGTLAYNFNAPLVADLVFENPNEGIDTIRSTAAYRLPDHVENLVLLGEAAVSGTGNALSNVLEGNSAANTLGGGGGSDRFDYNGIGAAPDTISDFTRGAGGDVLDIRDVLIGYSASTSEIADFVQLSGSDNAVLSVNADGVGSDFVALATLQNVAMTPSLLNEMLAQGNLLAA